MRVTLLAAAALCSGLGRAAAQRVEAGLVDSVAGVRNGLRVARGGTWETLGRLQPLYAGDSVAATGADTRARLRLYGRAAVWVCASPEAHAGCVLGMLVPAPARGGGLGAALRVLVHQALDPLLAGGSWSRTVSTVARGDDDIVVPLMATSPVLGAGERVLEVAWKGGTAPFAVQVVQDGKGKIAGAEKLGGPAASLGRMALAPGEYGLRIEDAKGTVRQVRFSVVPAARLPQAPKTLAGAELSGGTRALAGAVWLAGRPEGRWVWEAYLRLGGLGPDPTAERLRAELVAGRLPPAMP